MRKLSKNTIYIYDYLNIGEPLNKTMDIKENPFKTLDIVEVATNNKNNEFQKMITY